MEVGALVSQSLAVSEPMLREAGFVVEKAIGADLPLVMADPTAVSKCLENLMSNAIKYAGTALAGGAGAGGRETTSRGAGQRGR